MKKLLILFIATTSLLVSIQNTENLNIKNKQNISQFQFQIETIANDRVINGENYKAFYLDISLNGVTYNDSNFKNILLPSDNDELPNYADIFVPESNLPKIIFSLNYNVINEINYDQLKFTFGVFYRGAFNAWYHHQLIGTTNYPNSIYQYNFRDIYNKTGNNGGRLVIATNSDSNADPDSITANWNIQNYKF